MMQREIKRHLQAIRSMGMAARYISETEEFVVNFQATDSRYKVEATAYYTTDAGDAVATARVMLLNVKEVKR